MTPTETPSKSVEAAINEAELMVLQFDGDPRDCDEGSYLCVHFVKALRAVLQAVATAARQEQAAELEVVRGALRHVTYRTHSDSSGCDACTEARAALTTESVKEHEDGV